MHFQIFYELNTIENAVFSEKYFFEKFTFMKNQNKFFWKSFDKFKELSDNFFRKKVMFFD